MPSLSDVSRRRFLAAGLSGLAAAGVCGSISRDLNADDDPENADDVAATSATPLVDCHLHINHFDRSIEDTLVHMDATGATQAFILPLQTGEGGVTLPTETVLHAHLLYPDRMIPFCQTDIRQDDCLERIRAYHLLGCRGVGEQKEHVPLKDPRVEAVIALCDELDWPITLHFQDGPNGYNQGLATDLEPYLKKYKRVRIIGHAQTWWANISADVPPADKTLYPKGPVKPGGLLDRLLGEYPNLYADMSAGSGYGALTRDEEFTARFIERHPRQFLFGSDCPCRDGKGENFKGTCYSTQLQKFLERVVTDKQTLQDIRANNALRALNGE